MNCKALMDQVVACNPKFKGQMYYNLSDLARLFTRGNREVLREIINRYSIPYYLGDVGVVKGAGGTKTYNIFDVYEAIEKTKWKESTVGAGVK